MSTFAILTSLTCLNCTCIHLVTSSVAVVEEPPHRSTVVLAGAAQGKVGQDREAPWQSVIRQYAAQPVAHILKRRRRAARCHRAARRRRLRMCATGCAAYCRI